MKKQVFDLLNAGPLRRFTIRGPDGRPFIVHNCVQATARDVFAEQMVRMDDAGLTQLFSVHDEVILEVEPGITAADIEAQMSYCPDWLSGCPVSAEAKVVEHYEK
jgi:DNA polymerase